MMPTLVPLAPIIILVCFFWNSGWCLGSIVLNVTVSVPTHTPSNALWAGFCTLVAGSDFKSRFAGDCLFFPASFWVCSGFTKADCSGLGVGVSTSVIGAGRRRAI